MGSERIGMDRVLRRECESEIEFERERERESTSIVKGLHSMKLFVSSRSSKVAGVCGGSAHPHLAQPALAPGRSRSRSL
jgi:hypothetical protein